MRPAEQINDSGTAPCVYFIIANFNYSDFLLDTLNGIVKQDYPNYGISIADDASTDDSVARVLRNLTDIHEAINNDEKTVWEGYYKGIHCVLTVLKQNGKQARARNHAINIVANRADLFCICDADDIPAPNKLARMVPKIMEDQAAIGAVCADYSTYRPKTGLKIREFKEPFSRDRIMNECIIHSNSLISKKCLEVVGLFDDRASPCEDFDLWMRISKHFIIVHIPEDLTEVKIHESNASGDSNKDAQIKAWRYVMEKNRGIKFN